MKFLWTTIHVNDLDASLNFYQQAVGLDLVNRFPAGAGEIAFLGEGETKLELMWNGGKSAVSHGKDISIGFAVSSVDEKIQQLAEMGVPVFSGPFQPNPHIKFFFIQDPDGVLVQLAEQMG